MLLNNPNLWLLSLIFPFVWAIVALIILLQNPISLDIATKDPSLLVDIRFEHDQSLHLTQLLRELYLLLLVGVHSTRYSNNHRKAARGVGYVACLICPGRSRLHRGVRFKFLEVLDLLIERPCVADWSIVITVIWMGVQRLFIPHRLLPRAVSARLPP